VRLLSQHCGLGPVVLSPEGLDMFRIGNIAVDGNMNPSDNPSFAERILVGGMSGRLPLTGWNRFG
jgi:hypothetical protein